MLLRGSIRNEGTAKIEDLPMKINKKFVKHKLHVRECRFFIIILPFRSWKNFRIILDGYQEFSYL